MASPISAARRRWRAGWPRTPMPPPPSEASASCWSPAGGLCAPPSPGTSPGSATSRCTPYAGGPTRPAGRAPTWCETAPTARSPSHRSPTPSTTCSIGSCTRRRRRRSERSASAAVAWRAGTWAGPTSPPSASCRIPAAAGPERGSSAPATSCTAPRSTSRRPEHGGGAAVFTAAEVTNQELVDFLSCLGDVCAGCPDRPPLAVRVHHHLSLPLSAAHHGPCPGPLPDEDAGAPHRRSVLRPRRPLLGQDLRHQLSEGLGDRHPDGVSVRDQLGRFLAGRRRGDRPDPRAGRRVQLLPGVVVPRPLPVGRGAPGDKGALG